jgi:hypothetical protein
MKRLCLHTVLGLLTLAVTGAHGAATNAVTASAPAPRRTSFESFKLVTDRNIFNGNRSGQRVVSRSTQQRPTRVDSFTLVGTMSSDKGDVAFFDGSESDYRKALKLESRIAGFTLKEIWPAGVKLVEGTNEIALRVGTALRREDEGYWRYAEPGSYSSSSGGFAASGGNNSWSSGRSRDDNNDRDHDRNDSSRASGGSSASSTAAAAPAEVDDVLRKLMEKREKENQ